jgi:anti-sigma B factor antagonist
MSFQITRDADGAYRVTLEGQLVYGNRDELKSLVVEQLARDPGSFVLDCSSCGYIDSSGLGVLVALAKKVREKGGTLRVEGLNEDLTTLFELTKLDQHVAIVRGVSR